MPSHEETENRQVDEVDKSMKQMIEKQNDEMLIAWRYPEEMSDATFNHLACN